MHQNTGHHSVLLPISHAVLQRPKVYKHKDYVDIRSVDLKDIARTLILWRMGVSDNWDGRLHSTTTECLIKVLS